VRAQQQRAACREVLLEPLDAFLLERLVAHREHLVGDEDVGRERGRHAKPRRTLMPEE
jgi:hypothetical protein